MASMDHCDVVIVYWRVTSCSICILGGVIYQDAFKG